MAKTVFHPNNFSSSVRHRPDSLPVFGQDNHEGTD